jgi:hypothetical protein
MASMAGAQQNNLSENEIREEMKQAVTQAETGLGHPEDSIQPRQDLERLLFTMTEDESAKKVFFYQMSSGAEWGMPATAIAAVVHNSEGIDQLYSFEGSREFAAFSDEFNRMVSSLALSITAHDVVDLAKLFLQSSVAGNPGEVLNGDIDLRLAVQNYYFSRYRDTWKMLDAYCRWWEKFRFNPSDVAPKISVLRNGDYNVTLHTLLTLDGKHPQVQEIAMTVSRTGLVNVRNIRSIFPGQSTWMFYDFTFHKPETW